MAGSAGYIQPPLSHRTFAALVKNKVAKIALDVSASKRADNIDGPRSESVHLLG